MTVRLPAICVYCAHYQGRPVRDPPEDGSMPRLADVKEASKPRCTAFGAAPIPERIWVNAADHRQPYEGDGGVQFQAVDYGAAYAAYIFDDVPFPQEMIDALDANA
jgi:hypothetical protein